MSVESETRARPSSQRWNEVERLQKAIAAGNELSRAPLQLRSPASPTAS